MDDYAIGVLTNIGLLSFLALSAYLLLVAGELSFGQQAFFGVGAYAGGILTAMYAWPLPLAALAVGVLLTLWWWRASLASPNPLIAVRSFSDRTIAIGSAVTALVAMSALQITVVFSLLMQAPVWTAAGLGLTATLAGLVKLPSNVSSVFAGPLGGWLAARGGGRFALIAGGAVTVAGWLLWFVIDVVKAK